MSIKQFTNEYEFSSNVYVFEDSYVIVVDPGFYSGDFKEYLKTLGKVDAVLLTHGHFDHIAGLDKLIHDYPIAKVYMSAADYEFLTNSYLNVSSYFGDALIMKTEVEKIVDDLISIGNIEIEVIKAPGHTRGSVFFFFKNANVLFTGDAITAHSIGITRYPTGNDKDMKSTIEKFLSLECSDETLVCPGHDNITTYDYIIKNNPYVK